jgi:VRR-NUC domain
VRKGNQEAQVEHAIRRYLGGRRDLKFWRSKAGHLFDPHTFFPFGRSLPTGHPDLCGYLVGSGRMLMIEVKSATGTLTPEQEQWAEMLRAGGVLYVLARSVADVEKALAVSAGCGTR